MKTNPNLTGLFLLLTLATLACKEPSSDEGYAQDSDNAMAAAPSEMHDFSLPLYDPEGEGSRGRMISLKADLLSGEKPVVVNFWATWCGPCLIELPLIEELAEKRLDLLVTTVAVADDRDYFLKYMERRGLSLPVLMDWEGTVAEGLKSNSLPTTLVFNTEGIILGKMVGSFHSLGHLEGFLDEALKESVGASG